MVYRENEYKCQGSHVTTNWILNDSSKDLIEWQQQNFSLMSMQSFRTYCYCELTLTLDSEFACRFTVYALNFCCPVLAVWAKQFLWQMLSRPIMFWYLRMWLWSEIECILAMKSRRIKAEVPAFYQEIASSSNVYVFLSSLTIWIWILLSFPGCSFHYSI